MYVCHILFLHLPTVDISSTLGLSWVALAGTLDTGIHLEGLFSVLGAVCPMVELRGLVLSLHLTFEELPDVSTLSGFVGQSAPQLGDCRREEQSQ